MLRKPFSELKIRQKRRRIEALLDSEKHEVALPECVECYGHNADNAADECQENLEISDASSMGRMSIASYDPNVTSDSNSSDVCKSDDSRKSDTSKSDSSTTKPELECNISCSTQTQRCENLRSLKLKRCLQEWANDEESIPNDCITRLLHKLSKDFPELPKTSKGLKERQKYEIVKMDSGEYSMLLNWQNSFTKILKNLKVQNPNLERVNMAVNIDGIPVYANSRLYSTYPILSRIQECPKQIVTVGIFTTNSSNKQLPAPKVFLNIFIEELKQFAQNVKNSLSLDLNIGPFICDAPMRSYLKNIVTHTAYNSCERCSQAGQYHGGHVTLLDTNAPLRSDVSFNERTDISHHKKDLLSPLQSELHFPMVSGFVLDYMHMCTIGVMKRILKRLFSSSANQTKKSHLSVHQKALFEEQLNSISNCIPSDFSRKFEGGFKNLSRWKATEFRTFLVYAGIVIFSHESIISKEKFHNFLLLSASMRYLLSDNMQCNMNEVTKMLKLFVEQSAQLYGVDFVSYNIHSIIHLPQDYLKYGNLETISCFPYESYLGSHIKRSVRSGYKPLHQISERVCWLNSKTCDETSSGNLPRLLKKIGVEDDFNLYKSIRVNDTKLSAGAVPSRDNCVMLQSGEIGIIRKILQRNSKIHFSFQAFSTSQNFFQQPVESNSLGIYRVSGRRNEKVVTLAEFSKKVMVLPHTQKKNMHIAILLL